MTPVFPGAAAIAGLGMTEMGKVFGRTAADFAAEAIAGALDDAGLHPHDVDGLLVNANFAPDLKPPLQSWLGLRDLSVLNVMDSYGATVGAMVQYAALTIATGVARTIVLVYADAPLQETRASVQYAESLRRITGMESLNPLVNGLAGANPEYALAAQRHMHLFGTTSEHLGAIAVSQRAWALKNPAAQMRKPMTLADHQASRMIAEPFHLFDCCLVSNGAVAIVMTSAERAADLRQPPVHLLAAELASPGDDGRTDREPHVFTGAQQSGARAFARAGLRPDDVDVVELYDCYTYTVLVQLEDYGFCAKGEGGPFVEDGRLGPGGSLAVNTGGGQLSAFYMWGMTPLAEAVLQVRGQAGERQVDRHEVALVSGVGGTLDYHATMLLGSEAA
jgi:acetyl-CoA acetyltransferase